MINACVTFQMTFGEQNTEKEAHDILSYAFENGINILDTAEAVSSPNLDVHLLTMCLHSHRNTSLFNRTSWLSLGTVCFIFSIIPHLLGSLLSMSHVWKIHHSPTIRISKHYQNLLLWQLS